MIDSHCHLDLPAFDNKRSQILENAKCLGVHKLLVPGLSIAQFQTLLSLKRIHPEVDIALGCHPYFLKELSHKAFEKSIEELADIAKQHCEDYVAIGECGLDGSLDISFDYQYKVLQAQIVLAQSFKKPLILHHRQSHNELIRILKVTKFEFGGVIHAFSGSYETAQTYIDLGFSLGIGGTITYTRAVKTRKTVQRLGLSHLLLETDSPDMPISGYQGQVNTPERLPLIAKALADLLEESLDEVISKTDRNYRRVFTPLAK